MTEQYPERVIVHEPALINDAGTNMFVIEGKELDALIANLQQTRRATYKLRLAVYGDAFTYKVNEGCWSAPVGRAQEPY